MVERWMFNSTYWNYHGKIIFSYWKRGTLPPKCMVIHKTESQFTRPPKRESRFKSNFKIYFIQKTINNKNKAKQHAFLLKWYTSLNSACKCTIHKTITQPWKNQWRIQDRGRILSFGDCFNVYPHKPYIFVATAES